MAPPGSGRLRLLGSLKANSFAIVVGIDTYEHDPEDGGFHKLRCAVNDARSVHAVLGETCGFDVSDKSRVRLLENEEATEEGVKKAFAELEAEAGELRRKEHDAQIRFVFFFAGHGVLRTDRRVACALHRDLNKPEGSPGLSGQDLVELTDTLRPAEAVYFLDCCGAGSAPWLSTPRRAAAWLCATDDRAAWEVPGQELSPFSGALVRGLRGEGGHAPDGVYASDLAHYLTETVPRLSDGAPVPQKPYFLLGNAIRLAVGENAAWADVSDDPASFPFDWLGDVWPEPKTEAFCCLLVSETTDADPDIQRELERLVRRSMDEVAGRTEAIDRRTLIRRPLTMRVDNAVRDSHWWRQTVNLLWRADVALFDLTAMEPAMMLLLGIRAVVRRGVSIMLVQRMPPAHKMLELPFALKELNLVPFMEAPHQDPSDAGHPNQTVPRILEAGYRLLASDPDYVDLPAFELLRRQSTVETDILGEGELQRALFLCSFDQRHSERAFKFFRRELTATRFGLNPFRTLEMRSPRLVSHSLAEAIRDTPFCVVDWTGFRPNVFFEMGMRLASAWIAPVCVLDERNSDFLNQNLPNPREDDLPPSITIERAKELRPAVRQLRWLKRMFLPLSYSETADDVAGTLEPIMARHRELTAARAGEGEIVGEPALGIGGYATYGLLREHLKGEHRRPEKTLDQSLEEDVEVLLGDTEKDLKAFALYPDDREEELRNQEAIVMLKDALWYLKGRHGDDLLTDEDLKKRYVLLGGKLAARLLAVDKERAIALRKAMNEFGSGTLKRVPTP